MFAYEMIDSKIIQNLTVNKFFIEKYNLMLINISFEILNINILVSASNIFNI